MDRLKPEGVNMRSQVVYALSGLVVAWLLLGVAFFVGVWQLSFAAVLLAAWVVGRDVLEEGYFHPLSVFGVFVLAMTLVGMVWMSAFMGDTLPFGAYGFQVEPQNIFALANEQLILFAAAYAGYLMVRGLKGRKFWHMTLTHDPATSLWLFFYALGFAALLFLIISSGGFSDLFSNWGAKYERAAGRGWIVLMTYSAYVGILLWYKRNILRPASQRYGGLVILALPMLLYGSRTEMMICILAAGFMDERLGRRPKIKTLIPAGALLAAFFVLFQIVRGQAAYDFLTAFAKALSMGVGYAIAASEGIVGDNFRLETLWLSISPLVPGVVENFMGVPANPNYVFTQARVPGAPSTQSMGVMGEANYIAPYGWSFFYYMSIGAALTWVGSVGWRKSLLLAAVVAGGAFRVARGGFTAGIANILLFLMPLVAAYLLSGLLVRLPKRPRQ